MIYVYSISLAPNQIIQEINREIHKFLCQGGKATNTKKIHLIDWDMVCSPTKCGRAGVRDPRIMNLTLGANFLWRVISGENAW